MAVVFLYRITVFLQQNTAASLLELYFNDSLQTVYARGGGCGSQQREVGDGADVVFRDTAVTWFVASTNQLHSAFLIPHFTFRIPQFRILP